MCHGHNIAYYAYPRRHSQAELAYAVWLNAKTTYMRTITHLSTKPARRRVTSRMCQTTLPLSQAGVYTGTEYSCGLVIISCYNSSCRIQ